jgi:magnesium transporter
MRSWLCDSVETVDDPSPAVVAERVAAGTPFWLDIDDPTDEVIDRLADRLRLHPLAVEDAKRFGQRGQLHIDGDVAAIVAFGLDRELREPVEVHCYHTTGFIITLRRAASPALEGLRRTGSLRPLLGGDPIQVLHHVIRALHTDFPMLIDHIDERLDSLEQRVQQEPRRRGAGRDRRDAASRLADTSNPDAKQEHHGAGDRHGPASRRHQR